MLYINYSFEKFHKDGLIFLADSDRGSDFLFGNTINKILPIYSTTLDLFPLDYNSDLYSKQYLVISQTNFRYNHRYFSHVRSDDVMIKYYPGRELIQNIIQNKTLLRRVNKSIDEMFLKTIFAGLNSYKVMNSTSVVHFLSFSPVFLYFYKSILKICRFFLSLDEFNMRFVYLSFKHSKKRFKKIKSIKKNLRKKNLTQVKSEDYTIITV